MECLPDWHVVKAFRYVDDYLLILDTNSGLDEVVAGIVDVFKEASGGLKFTWEIPVLNCIRFLDLMVMFSDDHVCWKYSPRSKKSLVSYKSAHSKLVKRGIALTCLQAALAKSCKHQMGSSFAQQVKRLENVGYPPNLVSSCCESLLQKIKRTNLQGGSQTNKVKRRVHVIPYWHKVSHNIKKIASRYDVNVVFSAPCKLSKICPMLTRQKKALCSKKHAVQYTECVTNVVYEIPLSCGKVYIGQTGRCFNDRAREHNLSVRNNAGGHLADHCRRCADCKPLLAATKFLKKSKDKTEREIIEAFYIKRKDDNCISMPSLFLLQKEVMFLDGCL